MRGNRLTQPLFRLATVLILLSAVFLPTGAAAVHAAPLSAPAANPVSVTIAGSLQSEIGCGGDWDPACAASHLTYDAADDVWQGTFSLPAGSYEYKAAINDSWDENYGLHAAPGGANIPLNLAGPATVKFYFDYKTKWVTDNANTVIAVSPGSFQSELGCPGDWDPGCLRSWLQDPDGDGVYTLETTVLPVGSYEAKVALNESWDLNFGQGGVLNGPNIPFSVTTAGSTVTFSYEAATHILTITVKSAGPGIDNDIWWDGLRHDSRDLLYRTPGGAVAAGTSVKLRFRTYHNDVTAVKVRVYDVNTGGQSVTPMTPAATDVDCYQAGLPYTCDFWESTVTRAAPDNLWYRFIVTDGTKTVYYADNTPALDGGLGATTDSPVDNSYALMFYVPGFSAPKWAKNAFIYQIFPDRFRNGVKANDPKTGDVRYDDPVLKLAWGTLPEGFCRNYADGATNCPWRFDTTPPDWSPTKEQPRGRDYMGGDLRGVDQALDYIRSLGVNTIYFNPIFDAGSNHGYDTQDYYKVDPYFGTQQDWDTLVKDANRLGIRIVLDGVFNHMSSDSPFFDRYGHYATVGACESLTSAWRSWFTFHDVAAGAGPCVGAAGPNSATYDGWFGFDTIPVLNKSNPDVQKYFVGPNAVNPNNVSTTWLKRGASAWRLDVMGDASFPAGYWETFRQTVKQTKPDSLIISETWQKDSTLLKMLRGQTADTTMNYRLRDAIIGFLTPGPFDAKGFPDSGRIISATEFANRLASIREDYPDAAYYSAMNLLDSHDTERLLWAMTPGADTTADKEKNAANVAAGKQRQRIASLIQFTMPGAPTVFYGDEVGVTGDDDPDDRRTYPWLDQGGQQDKTLTQHYRALGRLRQNLPVLMEGDFRILATDDAAGLVAYGRKTGNQVAVVIVNRGAAASTGALPVAGYIPDGTLLTPAFAVGSGGGRVIVTGGQLQGTVGANSAVLLVSNRTDLTPPAAPTGLTATEGVGQVSLAWNAVSDAASYNVYRSPVSGGGYVKISTTSGLSFTDTGLRNGQTFYYVVTALDAAGNESAVSNEASALPHFTIGWANLQWPPTMSHTISVVNRTDTAYGQVWIDGVTSQPGQSPTLLAQLGFGPGGSNPAGNAAWTWVDASFNTDAGNNDEFKASMLPETVGSFDYLYRYSTTGGRDWLYADLNGPIAGGSLPPNPGKLTVNPSGDTTAPATPTGLRVTSQSPAGISLAWDAVAGDPSLYGYEVLRSDTAGGPYAQIARVTTASYTDTNVVSDAAYFYVVRSVDTSFNRSGNSAEVKAVAELRTVTLNFNVTVPATTDATGKSVYIAGFLDRLDGNLPQWDPGGVALSRVDATHWSITLTGKETTQIEYKYALGSWDFVEKDNVCGEVSNRQLTLAYGATGAQTVNDTVQNWRNVAPCGN